MIYCRDELAARTLVEHPEAARETGRSLWLGFEEKWRGLAAYKLLAIFGQ